MDVCTDVMSDTGRPISYAEPVCIVQKNNIFFLFYYFRVYFCHSTVGFPETKRIALSPPFDLIRSIPCYFLPTSILGVVLFCLGSHFPRTYLASARSLTLLVTIRLNFNSNFVPWAACLF